MGSMEDAKEEIRARLSIEDVVGRYVELKRAGRNLKGRSPWGVDKTPSFMVSPEKGIWHDFSAKPMKRKIWLVMAKVSLRLTCRIKNAIGIGM